MFSKCFDSHRRSSHVRGNPTWNDTAPAKVVQDSDAYTPTTDRQIKAPTSVEAHVVGWSRYFGPEANGAFWRLRHNVQWIQRPQSRRQQVSRTSSHMNARDDEIIFVRAASAWQSGRQASEELCRSGHARGEEGRAYRQGLRTRERDKRPFTFGRGRRAALSLASRSPGRRVVVMARIVRHQGGRFRSAPLSKHVAYLKREGVTRDGADAQMFDATSESADTKTFAERCEDDRHHFRFTVSPEDASEMADLRTFTRELMADAERDLNTRLDWVAVDHWNTDNPHVHVLVRGRANDGRDLVISRDYISRGFRARAEERVTLELGPRSEQEIRLALESEVGAERWTSLDRVLRSAADEGAGVADLRPGIPDSDPELRRLMIGRAAKLERLGLAEQVAPGCWTLKPGIEGTLRDLSVRGDIIKTMHRAITGAGREPDLTGFALHGDQAIDPVEGRLVGSGTS